MTRIIQWCSLVLAFTGILLSSAQEAAKSGISTHQSSGTSPSAPESSSYSVETTSFYSSTDKTKDENIPSTEAAAESISYSEAAVKDNHGVTTDVIASEDNIVQSSTSFYSSETTGGSVEQDISGGSASTSSVSHSEELSKARLPIAESGFTEIYSNKSPEDKVAKKHDDKQKNSVDEASETTSTTANVSDSDEEKKTSEAAAIQSNEVNTSENPNDSGQSSVPSKEEISISSSSVDSHQSTDKISSFSSSNGPTEPSEIADERSSTHKRSLNATRSMVQSTPAVQSDEIGASTPVNLHSTNVGLPDNASGKNIDDIVDSMSTDIFTDANSEVKKEDTVSTAHNGIEFDATSLPQVTDSEVPVMLASASHFIESKELMPETISSGYFHVHSFSPISSVALSSSEESIHPSEKVDSTAQMSKFTNGIRTTSSVPHRSSELEVENADATSHFYSSASLVTFDPNGMTHNFPQDPDSVTFVPEKHHEQSTNAHLSPLVYDEVFNAKPETFPQNLTTYETGVLENDTDEIDGHFFEREREFNPSSPHDLFPHDEPDKEEMINVNITSNTKGSKVNTYSTSGPAASGTIKKISPSNDESEEMLNDSPHFIDFQGKLASTPTAEEKYLNKDLEINVSNDITHSADSGTQNNSEYFNELDHMLDHQSEQSEIRPVTVISPLKTSESKIFLPESLKVESSSPAEVRESGQPDKILPDTLSPIQFNPKSSVINQNTETSTVVLRRDLLPIISLPPNMLPKDYKPDIKPDVLPTVAIPTDLLPKDYTLNQKPQTLTTVETPPNMLPRNYTLDVKPQRIPTLDVPLDMLPKNFTFENKPEKLPAIDVPLDMIPKNYTLNQKAQSLPTVDIPADLLPKNYTTSIKPQRLPTIDLPPGMLPKNFTVKPEVVDVPLDMLPKNFTLNEKPASLPTVDIPLDMLPKNFTLELKPEKLPTEDLPLNLLPKDYPLDGKAELENDTSSNSSSTIAGVAVKTSVSVSFPLLNSPNDTGNSNENPSVVVAVTTETPEPPTTSSGLRIRKPKIRINGDVSEAATPRTRKPFLASQTKPTTTVGPPVSIFKKSRTRVASITSSTTARPFRQFSTIRVHYASRIPGLVPDGELVFSVEPIPMTTTVPTTTETEEPFTDEPFTEQTQGPVLPTDDNVTLIKVAGCITVDKGLRWHDLLNNRHSPLYRERANFVQKQLDRLFRTSPINTQLWRIQIDGFSGRRNSRSVVIDFFLYLIKSPNEVTTDQLVSVFTDKLKNNTFSRFTVDTNKTTFEFLNEEPMKPTTEPPEEEIEPVIPQWAIAVIVVGAASLIFIVLFAAVAILGRHHVRRRYGSKLDDEDSDRPSDWESKMAAAYENLAADTIYDVEDMHSDSYKKRHPNSTYHGRPSRMSRADSWSSSDWSPPPRRPRPQVHRMIYD